MRGIFKLNHQTHEGHFISNIPSSLRKAFNAPILISESLWLVARPDAQECLHAGVVCCVQFVNYI